MNAINWFEIPTADFTRAVDFYGNVLGIEFHLDDSMPHSRLAVFPHGETGVGGALAHSPNMKPTAEGTVVYIGTAELDAALGRVPAAGGAVLMAKTFLGDEIGHIALIRDSEGNTVGLHQPR
ncbi:VOC family protein [Chitinimonas koreensis]|uniref:VOC family protein n=1 Tax=Chitinimonas koreensis TaxID=356302 RepID=UPI00040065A1|nr:VOC family protein [Chitinimonas koreensis]QNM95965.1 VOC family protein [Chitinimonas koreensis]